MTSVLVKVDPRREQRQQTEFNRKAAALDDEVVLCTCREMHSLIQEKDRDELAPNFLRSGLGSVSLAPTAVARDPYPVAGCKITMHSGKSWWCYDFITIK